MAEPGGMVIVNGQEIYGYRGLDETTDAFLRALITETHLLQPWEAETVDIIGPTFYIAMAKDIGGNVLVALSTEFPLNPNANLDPVPDE